MSASPLLVGAALAALHAPTHHALPRCMDAPAQRSFDPRAPRTPWRERWPPVSMEQYVVDGLWWCREALAASPARVAAVDTEALACTLLACALADGIGHPALRSELTAPVLRELLRRRDPAARSVLEADCTPTTAATQLLCAYACAELYAVSPNLSTRELLVGGLRAVAPLWSDPGRARTLDGRALLVAVALQERAIYAAVPWSRICAVEALTERVAERLVTAPDDLHLMAAAILCELGLARPVDARGVPALTAEIARRTSAAQATVWRDGAPLDWVAWALAGRALLWSAAPEWSAWRFDLKVLLIDEQVHAPPFQGSWAPPAADAPESARWARTGAAVALLCIAGESLP
jgi:hypothetical protein